MTHVQLTRQEKNNKSDTKQKSSHPSGWCTGRFRWDGLLIGCSTAPWLGAGGVGGQSELACDRSERWHVSRRFGLPSSAAKDRESLLAT